MNSWWGGWFPEGPGLSYWGGWFPEGSVDTGLAPAGAATFALLLEDGITVTYTWRTGMFKPYSGREKRSNLVDDPKQEYSGSAILVGADTRTARARLAQYASLGRPFLLGLPYEELSITADSAGTTVPVASTAFSDWALVGGRVVLRHETYGSWSGVITAVGASSFDVVDVLGNGPGNFGKYGATIMPAMAVYLDAQQGFDRYKATRETWNLRARNAIAGYASPEARAKLAVPGLAGVTIYGRLIGSAANTITVRFVEDGSTLGNIVEDVGLRTIVVHYDPATTPRGRLATMFSTSTLAYIEGAAGITAIGYASAFGPTALAGGADFVNGAVGRGAAILYFAGRPVFNRRIEVEETTPDSMQSLVQTMDLGGLPFSAGSTKISEWGRHILTSGERGPELQWARLFLDTIKGKWLSFWLATWRADLIPVSSGVGTLTVEGGVEDDFFAWWPLQQQYIQIRQTSGVLTYARIASAAISGANVVLSIVDAANVAITLSALPVVLVSWIERVRMDSDSIPIVHIGTEFILNTMARVVQQ